MENVYYYMYQNININDIDIEICVELFIEYIYNFIS